MIMADVWKILFLILGTQAVMVSYWLLAAALFPATLRRARAAYDQRSGRVTVTGLLVAVPTLLVGAGLLQGPHPLLKLIGGVLVSTPIALGLVGRPGCATGSARDCPVMPTLGCRGGAYCAAALCCRSRSCCP